MGATEVVARSADGVEALVSERNAARASRSVRRCCSDVTPRSFRSSAVRFGRTVSSISFSRNAASYLPRPRLRSQTTTSIDEAQALPSSIPLSAGPGEVLGEGHGECLSSLMTVFCKSGAIGAIQGILPSRCSAATALSASDTFWRYWPPSRPRFRCVAGIWRRVSQPLKAALAVFHPGVQVGHRVGREVPLLQVRRRSDWPMTRVQRATPWPPSGRACQTLR